MRVLYFTVVPIGAADGGSMCVRNHLRRLAEDAHIDLFAIVVGRNEWREGDEAFLTAVGVPHHFIPFRDGNVYHEANGLRAIAAFLSRVVFQIP